MGAEITGSTLTFTRASGTDPISVTLPMTGEAVADGTVTSAVINEATNVVTLTRSVGTPLTFDLSYLVSAAGLTLSDVDARITGARVRTALEVLLGDNRLGAFAIRDVVEWKGTFPVGIATYEAGDLGYSPTNEALHLCRVGGQYSRATIVEGPNWVCFPTSLIVRADANGNLPAAVDHQGAIGLKDSTVQASVLRVIVEGHAKEVTLATLQSGGLNVSGTVYFAEYRGIFAGSLPDANSATYPVNSLIYVRSAESFYRNRNNVGGGGRHWAQISDPDGVVAGTFHRDADFENVATAVGQLAPVGIDISTLQLRIVTAYVAPLATETEWVWVDTGITRSDVQSMLDALKVVLDAERVEDQATVANASPFKGLYAADTEYFRGDYFRHGTRLFITTVEGPVLGMDPFLSPLFFDQISSAITVQPTPDPINAVVHYRQHNIVEIDRKLYYCRSTPAAGLAFSQIPTSLDFIDITEDVSSLWEGFWVSGTTYPAGKIVRIANTDDVYIALVNSDEDPRGSVEWSQIGGVPIPPIPAGGGEHSLGHDQAVFPVANFLAGDHQAIALAWDQTDEFPYVVGGNGQVNANSGFGRNVIAAATNGVWWWVVYAGANLQSTIEVWTEAAGVFTHRSGRSPAVQPDDHHQGPVR